MLEELSQAWEKKNAKLAELQDWLRGAQQELISAMALDNDPRWATVKQVKAAAEKMQKELDSIEEQQEAALTESLTSNGPCILELEDGSTRTLSATPRTAGGGECLLPRDFLNVWRVTKVCQGSVMLGDMQCGLRFGDKGQIATVKLAPKIKKAKKDAVIGEGGLFGRD